MYKIFLVEDDSGIAGAITQRAKAWDFDIYTRQNLHDIREEFASFNPHLVLLDISLPFFDGYHWCGEIRKSSKVPIIFISSTAEKMNMIMAMNMGADDFIAKPFDISLLMTKIGALLRRTYDFSHAAKIYRHRGAILNPADSTFIYNGEKISLSKNEFRILLILMENKGKTVSREKMMKALWETDYFVDENTLSVNVNRLRKRLDRAGLHDFITTKFGMGYIIED